MVKIKQYKLEDLYEVFENELGSAAMGCKVVKVRKKATGELFACKTFDMNTYTDKSTQKNVAAMLRNEIEMLRRLDHPNVIRAYETIESDNCIHIIMELCEGGDLGSRTYSEADSAVIISKLLRAIVYCHRYRVCHRDLKFENILWESKGEGAQGEPKLIDFGMSREFAAGVSMRERVGTVYTMAPEVLKGRYTEMADLWSIGCITFQLVTGTPAFECETELETVKKLQTVKYAWPKGTEISSEAKEFVYKLLKYDPSKRITAQEALNHVWITKWTNKSDETLNEVKLNKVMSQRTLNSMRTYSTFGPFKKTALMVLAYKIKPQQLSLIRKEFEKYDKDETGSIKLPVMRTVLLKQGVQNDEIDRIFKSMDVDQTGKIRYLEFLAAALGAMDDTWLNESRLKDAFQCIDVDHTGVIQYENLKALLGRDYKTETVQKMLEEATCERGMGITFEQFVKLMHATNDAFVEEELNALEILEESVHVPVSIVRNLRLFTETKHKESEKRSSVDNMMSEDELNSNDSFCQNYEI